MSDDRAPETAPESPVQPDLLAALQSSVDAARTKFRTEPATVCVRLDGLESKIARAIAANDMALAGEPIPWEKLTTGERSDYESNAAAVFALVQSLAVQ